MASPQTGKQLRHRNQGSHESNDDSAVLGKPGRLLPRSGPAWAARCVPLKNSLPCTLQEPALSTQERHSAKSLPGDRMERRTVCLGVAWQR